MTTEEIKHAFRAIGLALSASHNCVITDCVDAEPDELSWRSDHSKELNQLRELEANFLKGSDG